MDNTEMLGIADAWIEYHHAGDHADEHHKDFWAYERLGELTSDEPETAWQLIITILRRDPSDAIIANLAAGPMEDLLGAHGDRFIQRVEDLAMEDSLFHKLVGVIWKNEIPDRIWSRLRAILPQM